MQDEVANVDLRLSCFSQQRSPRRLCMVLISLFSNGHYKLHTFFPVTMTSLIKKRSVLDPFLSTYVPIAITTYTCTWRREKGLAMLDYTHTYLKPVYQEQMYSRDGVASYAHDEGKDYKYIHLYVQIHCTMCM